MLATALLALLQPGSEAFQFNLLPGTGLVVSANGLPLVQGSGFQIYAPGWTRGYFGSSYGAVKVSHLDSNSAEATFTSGSASGAVTYRRDGTTLHVDETFRWDADEPALVEVTAAKLWEPALGAGTASANGAALPGLVNPPDPKADMMARRVGPDGANLEFKAPWGSLKLIPKGSPWFMFDARGYPQEYAEGKSLLWYGLLGVPLPKGQPVHLAYDLVVQVNPLPPAQATNLSLEPVKLGVAEATSDNRLPLVPFPKGNHLTTDLLELGGPMSFPAGRFFHFAEFEQALANRFRMPAESPKLPGLTVDGGIHDMKLPHEGYRLIIRNDGFTVFGQDENGLRHGLQRLAMLAVAKDGHVWLPIGALTDWPSTPWRGVHMFVGPNAPSFHRELMEKLLMPMGFNEVVLECERSAWTSLPNVRGHGVMALDDLANLFKAYRKHGFDAIPLVQSFGHMDWFFQGGANKDLAVNPDQPYGVDPRKPGVKETLDKLWDEVINVTEPTTIHFGCDEVDMEGWQANPQLMTDLWKLQMPILGAIAKKHDVKMMLWGDMALAPGEAIDATNGSSGDQAEARRAAIPAGSMIADWHYKADPHMDRFLPSLDTWKKSGLIPIASTWHEADNVFGFTAAGVQDGAGTLKTTWSTENSSAGDALSNFDEYAAMVLAGEYAWSGRQDPPSDLGYDYRELFRRLYFAPPVPLQSVEGIGLSQGSGSGLAIGRYRFSHMEPVSFYSALDGKSAPQAVTVKCNAPATTVVLACTCSGQADVSAPVATVVVTLANGTTFSRELKYGEDVRALSDGGICPLAETAKGNYAVLVRLPKGRGTVSSITVKSANTYAGFRLLGITLL